MKSNILQAEVDRLKAIIKKIDEVTPRADNTCTEPGIAISEAVRRKLIHERHPLFVGDADAELWME